MIQNIFIYLEIEQKINKNKKNIHINKIHKQKYYISFFSEKLLGLYYNIYIQYYNQWKNLVIIIFK